MAPAVTDIKFMQRHRPLLQRDLLCGVLWGGLLAVGRCSGAVLPQGGLALQPLAEPMQSNVHLGRGLHGFLPLPHMVDVTAAPRFFRAAPTCVASQNLTVPALFSQGLTYVESLPAAVQSISSGLVWRHPCAPRTAAPPAQATQIPYTFDDPAVDVPPYNASVGTQSLEPLPASTRKLVLDGMRKLSSFANIDFIELPNATVEQVTLRVRYDRSKAASNTGQLAYDKNGRPVISMYDNPFVGNSLGFAAPTVAPLRSFMLALGACPPQQACLPGAPKLPVQFFNDTQGTTVLSGSLYYCTSDNFGLLGPLDRSLLVTGYGLRPNLAQDNVITLTHNNYPQSVIDTQGVNTLAARSKRYSVLYLGDDGRAVCRVGNSVTAIAPLSNFTIGDLQESQGGMLVGTSADNIFYGSAFNDTFDGAGGNDQITTGAGRDTIVVRSNTGTLVVTDFEPAADRLAVPFTQTLPTLETFGNQTTLTFQDKVRVKLVNTGQQAFNVSRDIIYTDPLPDLTVCGVDGRSFPADTFEDDFTDRPNTGDNNFVAKGILKGLAPIVGIGVGAVAVGGLYQWLRRRRATQADLALVNAVQYPTCPMSPTAAPPTLSAPLPAYGYGTHHLPPTGYPARF